LERERKPAGGADAPAKAERGINSEATGTVSTDNLAASVQRSQTEQRVDSCLERARKLMMIGQSANAPAASAYAFPEIFASHQRSPTNRKRQSLKNSGGSPSK
jgi:hypothetical protein